MAEVDFSNKKALLIEDMAEARILQKKMLGDFGFKQIEVAMKAESAIELLRHNTYDLVLSDYNLGNGKDGQQLLEEVRHSSLIPNTSTYIMVTAETSIEMVMGAIEYQPDGYITKPFSQALLQRRLRKLLDSKEKLQAINLALDHKDFQSAITEAEKLTTATPYLAGKCQRIIGECLIELKKYDEAKKIYSDSLKNRKMPWALFGLAKVLFFQQRYSEAENKFKQLTLDNRFFVNAYDWLAKCLVAQGKDSDAQEVLIQAISKSPKNILRQLELGRLSQVLGKYSIAEMSYRRAVFLAKHSCYNLPEIYLGHLESLVHLATHEPLDSRQKDGFQTTLKRLEANFSENPEVQFKKYELIIQFYVESKQTSQAILTLETWDQAAEQGQTAPPPEELRVTLLSLQGK